MTTLTKEMLDGTLKGSNRNTFMTPEMKEVIHSSVKKGKLVKEIAEEVNKDPRFKGIIKNPKQTYNRIFNYLTRMRKSMEVKEDKK